MLSFGDDEYWEDGEDEALEVPHALQQINQWLESDKVHEYGPLTNLTIGSGGAGMTASVSDDSFLTAIGERATTRYTISKA